MHEVGLLEQYRRHLLFRSLATASLYRYLRIAEMYLEHSKGKLSRGSVESFINLFSNRSGTYRRFIFNVLKGLFAVADVSWPFSPRETPKLSEPYQPFLKIEDVHRLLYIARGSSLDYALIRVAAATGCRREELSQMMLEDYSSPYLTVRTAKGGERRVRTLDPETVQAVDDYLGNRHLHSRHLFISERGVPLSPTTLGNRFRVLVRKAGFGKGVGWHAIRRGVVTWLFEGGMREKELQELIGWRSVTMPARYIQLVPGKMEEKAKEAHPLWRASRT